MRCPVVAQAACLVAREAINIIIIIVIIVGAVIVNIIIGFIFTVFSGRGVHGGLN